MLSLSTGAQAQDDESFSAQRDAQASAAVRQLTERDALVRQRAAEVLAELVAVEQQRLVEGYRYQEKNERVRLALDWALYRMGKTSALYSVVKELRSDTRRTQAVGYLSQLVNPQLLHPFFDGADNKMLLGLLETAAHIGDTETLDLVKPYTSSFDPKVAEAAQFATREIATRLAQSPPNTQTRPREAGKSTDVSP